MKERAGTYIAQPHGLRPVFHPRPLPPDPAVDFSSLAKDISEADRAVARLDAIQSLIPDPDMFVRVYAQKDAVLSSQIEGLHTTFADVIEAEAGIAKGRTHPDLLETQNYMAAMDHAIRQSNLPLSLRLIREMHGKLLQGVRGSDREPGEFRRSQNWIGASGANLLTATYVPPPPEVMMAALNDLELFLHQSDELPPLVKIGLAHSQFETIHPFLDGNGRIGRLLVSYLLIHYGVLRSPVLYTSLVMRLNRDQYYTRLQAVRDAGDWEGWLKFFLTCVKIAAIDGFDRASQILALRERCEASILEREAKTAASLVRIAAGLFRRPIINSHGVIAITGASPATAIRHLRSLVGLEILKPMWRSGSGQWYEFKPYLDILYAETVADIPDQGKLFD